jgi:hypothetical protein
LLANTKTAAADMTTAAADMTTAAADMTTSEVLLFHVRNQQQVGPESWGNAKSFMGKFGPLSLPPDNDWIFTSYTAPVSRPSYAETVGAADAAPAADPKVTAYENLVVSGKLALKLTKSSTRKNKRNPKSPEWKARNVWRRLRTEVRSMGLSQEQEAEINNLGNQIRSAKA